MSELGGGNGHFHPVWLHNLNVAVDSVIVVSEVAGIGNYVSDMFQLQTIVWVVVDQDLSAV